ncbi:hypothetical protein RSAG8_08143, partial [Rhizoctonia solani AG-8 WAC10335]
LSFWTSGPRSGRGSRNGGRGVRRNRVSRPHARLELGFSLLDIDNETGFRSRGVGWIGRVTHPDNELPRARGGSRIVHSFPKSDRQVHPLSAKRAPTTITNQGSRGYLYSICR